MEKLCEYLDERKDVDFARAVGISPPYLSQIKRGLRRPSVEVIEKIAAESGGAVPAQSWFPEVDEGVAK